MNIARRKLAISPLTRPGTIVAWNPKSWDADFDVVVVEDKNTIPAFEKIGDAAVITIRGALVQHGNWLQDGYDDFLKRLEKACQSDLPRVGLDIVSPGGDFAGCLEFSKEGRALLTKYKKPSFAFTGTQAASAAYAIACMADKIIATDSACVGSIGAWAPLVDATAQDKMMGMNIRIVASGALKTKGNPHVAISDDAFEATQATVDGMAALFFEWVSERRSLPISKIKALEGSDFLGGKAQALGLVDEISLSLNAYLSGGATASPSKGKAMGKMTEEARVALRKCIDGDGDEDEKKKASKALKALEDDEKEEKKDEEAKAKAADESKKKEEEEAKAKAKAADEEKEKEAKAQAAAGDIVAMARRLHDLETERAAEKLAAQRAQLLASRPDFSEATRKTLASAPLSVLEDAVKTWPKIPGASHAASASASMTPNATRGENQGTDAQTPDTRTGDTDFIAKKMGTGGASTPTKVEDRSLTLGFLSDDDLQKRAKELGIR